MYQAPLPVDKQLHAGGALPHVHCCVVVLSKKYPEGSGGRFGNDAS